MVKFTSAALFLAMAAISSAAPIISSSSASASASASATPSATVTVSASVSATASATPSATDAVVADPTVISIAAKDDVFSSDVKYTGRATWFTHTYGACNEKWDG
ncbi:hypothetical protein BGZ70_005267, partial [Mortierella alpina]